LIPQNSPEYLQNPPEFPRISQNSPELPKVPKHFPEFPRIYWLRSGRANIVYDASEPVDSD